MQNVSAARDALGAGREPETECMDTREMGVLRRRHPSIHLVAIAQVAQLRRRRVLVPLLLLAIWWLDNTRRAGNVICELRAWPVFHAGLCCEAAGGGGAIRAYWRGL